MLALTIVCIGRAKAGAEQDLARRYLERARLAGRALGLSVDLREIGESKAKRPAVRRLEEASAIRRAFEGKTVQIVAFDEAGAAIDSEAFAALIRRRQEVGGQSLAFLIGGPDGLDHSIRDEASETVAFGAMTWPHQLVRIMAAEQVYRAITILAGHPYHRG